MKKLLPPLSLLALLPAFSNAQITIQADDVKLVGNFAIQSRDLAPAAGIQPGGTSSQTWDFSTLNNNEQDTLAFYEASETPYANLFPNANVAATLDSFAYLYFGKTDDHLKAHGSYGTLTYQVFTATTAYRYSPPRTIINFPMEYQDQFSETVRAIIQVPGSVLSQPFDSVRVVTTTQRNVTVDAYGALTTPLGTYQTLRTQEVEVSYDSFYIYNGGIWTPANGTAPTTITFYNWWTNENGLGSPVVQLEVKSNGNIEATWLYEVVSAVGDPAVLVDFNLSPNPASNLLKVELPEGFTGKMEVYDLNGRLWASQAAAAGFKTMDIQHLAIGNFVLVLKDTNGKLVGYERFAVVR